MLVKSLHVADHVLNLQQEFNVLDSYKMMLNCEKCMFSISLRQLFKYLVTWRGIKARLGQIKAILS